MTGTSLEQWRCLLAQTEIIYEFSEPGQLLILSAEQLSEFEGQAGVVLPSAYKEFCQVFGSGVFGRTNFKIHSPDLKDVEGQLASNQHIMEVAKGAYSYPEHVQQLLDAAYLFGWGEGYVIFFFDLRSYSDTDKSYDIYGICDAVKPVYNLGRDFFAFIRDVCLGDRAMEEFSELVEDGFNTTHPLWGQQAFIPGAV